jgi:hypothetical protein
MLPTRALHETGYSLYTRTRSWKRGIYMRIPFHVEGTSVRSVRKEQVLSRCESPEQVLTTT